MLKLKFLLFLLIVSLSSYSNITDGLFKNFLKGNGILSKERQYLITLQYQYPELPNGCEITTLAILLKSMGYDVDKMDLYLNYLPKVELIKEDGKYYGFSPEKMYIGDARQADKGWYCYEDAIIAAADLFFTRKHLENQVEKVSDLKQNDLDTLVKKGKPVMVWTTLDYSPITKSNRIQWLIGKGQSYTPNSNQHCVLIYGASDSDYFIADPISGWKTINKERFIKSFESLGSRAITVK